MTQHSVQRGIRVRGESPNQTPDGGERGLSGVGLERERLSVLPPGDAIRSAPDQMSKTTVVDPLRALNLGPDVRRNDANVPGRVQQLLRIAAAEPDQHRGAVGRFGMERSANLLAGSGFQRRIGIGIERKHHVVRGHRPAVMPARPWAEVKPQGQRVYPLPAFRQARLVSHRVERRLARLEVRQPLEDLIADVPPDRFTDQRGQKSRRLAGRGDDDGITIDTRRFFPAGDQEHPHYAEPACRRAAEPPT
mgnify:CR=1 FL=1